MIRDQQHPPKRHTIMRLIITNTGNEVVYKIKFKFKSDTNYQVIKWIHGIGSDMLIITYGLTVVISHWESNFSKLVGFSFPTEIKRRNMVLILTSVMAKHVVVFLLATRPMRALFLTMQYGTPIFRQRAGRNKTSWKQK